MTDKLQKFKDFYENKENWRPPSYAQICLFMGWKSKKSVIDMLERLKYENKNKPA